MQGDMFEKVIAVALIIILVAIAWAMWRPVLVDQRRLQILTTAIQGQSQIPAQQQQMQRSIDLLRVDVELLKQQFVGQE